MTLARSAAGDWAAEVTSRGESPLPPPGGDTARVGGALDPDLGLSSLFNSMPVLRHGLHDGGSADDFLMFWISVPDLSIHDGNRLVRFESVGADDDLVADPKGLVVDYPRIAAGSADHGRPV